MGILAGFSQVDITPPLGTEKMGWKKVIVADRVLDPLYARTVVIEANGVQVGFIQLDTESIWRTDVLDIRRRINEQYGFPGAAVMVAGVHNHAGPAVANNGDSRRDERYVADMVEKIVRGFGEALISRTPVEIGFGSGYEFRVAHNRRVVTRDGTVRTHGKFTDPNSLYIEGPIDPELSVTAFRKPDGQMAGVIVNYACHPTQEGGSTNISAGFPGVLAQTLKQHGCPITLYLNGAAGNVHTADPSQGGKDRSAAECGHLLAETALDVLAGIKYRDNVSLAYTATEVALPYRTITEQEIKGEVRGAQRFIDNKIYEREMPDLCRMIAEQKAEVAEVQLFWLDEHIYVAIPGELFTELGLAMKKRAFPQRATVVGYANGMVGYLPHRAAFEGGGYETTFCGSSRLAPGAGELLVEAALRLAEDRAQASA